MDPSPQFVLFLKKVLKERAGLGIPNEHWSVAIPWAFNSEVLTNLKQYAKLFEGKPNNFDYEVKILVDELRHASDRHRYILEDIQNPAESYHAEAFKKDPNCFEKELQKLNDELVHYREKECMEPERDQHDPFEVFNSGELRIVAHPSVNMDASHLRMHYTLEKPRKDSTGNPYWKEVKQDDTCGELWLIIDQLVHGQQFSPNLQEMLKRIPRR